MAIESDLLKLVKAQRLIRKSIKEKEAALDQRLAYLETLISRLSSEQKEFGFDLRGNPEIRD